MNWKVEALYVLQTGNHADVVTDVAWACYGNREIRGKVSLDSPGPSFVEYGDLTEQQVLEWVWAKVDRAINEKYVNAIIAAPADTSKPLPWE